MSARDDKLAAALLEFAEAQSAAKGPILWKRGAASFRAILARHGLAVLPVEPTENMLDAGLNERQDNDGNVTEIYRAMLAAAQEDRDDA